VKKSLRSDDDLLQTHATNNQKKREVKGAANHTVLNPLVFL